MKHIEQIPIKVREIYSIISELETMFGRHFTPDGHLVGSIGEVLAAYHYDLELYKESTETHDAISKSGIEVQIKATQTNKIGIRSAPQHLIVLALNKDGSNSEIYNGPGQLVWCNAGKKQKNGQRYITVFKLKNLAKQLTQSAKLVRIYT